MSLEQFQLNADFHPKVEDRLSLFAFLVENGKQPPTWLLEFMAEGAREFLRGGKPWQKGKGGRPPKGFDESDLKAWLLHFKGELPVADMVVALGLQSPDGADRSRTVRREIERGGLVYLIWQAGRHEALRDLVSDLFAADYSMLSTDAAQRCRDGLASELRRLKTDEQEPGFG